MKIKKGFTLVEILLTLSISTLIGFITFNQFLKNSESLKAKSAGQQIKLIGDATDAYISNHYQNLSNLSNSTGSTDDLGPRTCNSNNTCIITIKTLSNEGLLPSTYSSKNIYGSNYNIILKRSGTAPYYKIYGLIVTEKGLNVGNNIRYDLLGIAMQEAGIDSGMTFNSSSTVSGYNGAWNASVTDYSNINTIGQLAYQTGYGTYNYSVFLRRDGTLPMTGDLNMGQQDINNAVNITASGTTNSGTLVSSGDTNVGGNLTVAKTGSFTGNVGVKGMSPSAQPAGYLGGISSPDYYAQAGIYIAKNGTNVADKNWAFQANRDGYLGVSNNINAGGSISAAANVISGLEMTSHNGGGDTIHWGGADGNGDYEIRMDSEIPLTIWQSTNKSRLDKTLSVWGTQEILGNLNVSSSQDALGSISASGNIETGQYFSVKNYVNPGDSCSSVSLISRDSLGEILSCKNGIWTPEQPVGIPQPWPSTTPPNGWLVCDGSSFNTNTYPLLAKAYPSGILPDLRGTFIRGLDQGRGIDSGRTILSEQRASVVTGTDDNWYDNDVGVLHGPSSSYSRDSININNYSTGGAGQTPKYWVHFGGGNGPSLNSNQNLNAGDVVLNNNGSNGFYGGARPYNTAFIYIVRAL